MPSPANLAWWRHSVQNLIQKADEQAILVWNAKTLSKYMSSSSSFLACNSYDCVAPYVDIILHRGRFWAKSAASGSVRWCCFRACWTVLSHVMRGRPSCLFQFPGGEANRILLASALSSMHIICPNRVSRHDLIIAVSLGCFVSLRTSSFRTNWYHLMPSSIHRHLVECIDLACVHLRYRPAVRTMQEYW